MVRPSGKASKFVMIHGAGIAFADWTQEAKGHEQALEEKRH